MDITKKNMLMTLKELGLLLPSEDQEDIIP